MSSQANAAQRPGPRKWHLALCRAMVLLGVTGFFLIYFNKVFPASEAWHITFVNLMDQGRFPYRDFYYYLPPLDLWVSSLLWRLSFGSYLAYRGWRLLERVLIAELMFELLRKRMRPELAMLSCVTGAILSSASVYDLIGDYNQTVYLLIAVFLWAALRFLHSEGAARSRAAFGVGLCLGLIFLGKQPHFVACVLVMLPALLWYGWRTGDRKTGWYVLFALSGTLLPIGACALWLGLHGALLPFIEQIFLYADSKGSVSRLLFNSLYSMLVDWDMIPIFLGTALLWFLRRSIDQCRSELVRKRYFRIGLDAASAAAMLWMFFHLIHLYRTSLHELMGESHALRMLLLLCLTLVPAVGIVRWEWRRGTGEKRQPAFPLAPVLIFAVTLLLDIFLTSRNIQQLSNTFYRESLYFYNLTAICQQTVSMLLAVGLAVLAVQSLREERFERWDLFFLLAVAFAGNYAAKMGTGESLCTPHHLILSVPILLCAAFPREGRQRPLVQSGALTACFLLIFVLGCQKSMNSYRWWGWEEAPVSEHTESLDIEGLEGFRVTPEVKAMYEEITRVVRENSREDSHVLGYPHIVIFNQLTGRNRLDRFVPVYFYDICSSRYVEQDIERLQKDPPDLIVYQDLPGCYENHTYAFQDGQPLPHYALEEWLSVNRNLLYDTVGQIGNLYVYKLRDNGIEQGYTYLEGVNRNTTASVVDRFSDGETVRASEKEYAARFSGEGSIGDPYLIRSQAELLLLSEAVEHGAMFEGKVFRQTADIDLSSIPCWEPIGPYDSGVCFRGTYDGGGHTVSGVRCSLDLLDGRAGLFGDLAGTVVNLVIRDSVFAGRTAGAIANDCLGGGAILNCCALDCKIRASQAAGGIAGSFSGGRILNCFSDVRAEVLPEERRALQQRYPFARIVPQTEGCGIALGADEVRSCLSVGLEPFAGNDSFRPDSSSFALRREELDKAEKQLNRFIEESGNPNYVNWIIRDGALTLER